VNAKKKFVFSLSAFAALGVMSWLTLSNDPIVLHDFAAGFVIHIHFRNAVLVILGIWTLLTTLAFFRAQNEEHKDAAGRK